MAVASPPRVDRGLGLDAHADRDSSVAATRRVFGLLVVLLLALLSPLLFDAATPLISR